MRLKKLSLCLVLVALMSYSTPNVTIQPAVVRQEVKKEVDIDYARICEIESSNQDSAVSKEGAIGVMQLMPSTLAEWNNYHPGEHYTKGDLFNRKINMKLGTWLLAEQIPYYLKKKKIPIDVRHKLIAYNWGIGSFVTWYEEGSDYSCLPEDTKYYLTKYHSYGNERTNQ